MAPSGGIDKSLPVNLIKDNLWSDGDNVHFGQGYVEKVGGWTKFIADKLDGEIMAIDNYYKFNGYSYLMIITTKRVYYYDPAVSASPVDITGETFLTGTVEYPVITENAQNVFVFTNGVDPIKYWDGTGTIKDLPGLNDCEGGAASVRAKSLLYFNNFLLLLNTVEDGISYPQRFRWSQLGDIFTWKNNVDGSGQAGWGDLTDGVDWGVALRPLGNYVVAYKERSIQVLSYVGGDTIWDKRPAIMGTGLLAPKALVDLGDEHIFIGPDNVYSFNLIEPKIAGDAIAKEFFKILDPGKTQTINNAYIEEIPEAWFVFASIAASKDVWQQNFSYLVGNKVVPAEGSGFIYNCTVAGQSGDAEPNWTKNAGASVVDGEVTWVNTGVMAGYPDKAIVYNTDTKAWSMRDMPMLSFGYYNRKDEPVWDTDEEEFDIDNTEWDSSTILANAPINLCGDAQGFIYVLDGNSKDGADIACFMRTKLFDFGNPVAVKRVKRIQFMVSREGPYNMQVRVGTAANVDEPISWSEPKYMSLDKTTPPWIDIDVTARYMMFEFATLQRDQPFRLTGYIVYYDERGIV